MTQAVHPVAATHGKQNLFKAAKDEAQGAEPLDAFQNLLEAQMDVQDVQPVEGGLALAQDGQDALNSVDIGKTLPQPEAAGGNVLPQVVLSAAQSAALAAAVTPGELKLDKTKVAKGDDVVALQKTKTPSPDAWIDTNAVDQGKQAPREDFSTLLQQGASATQKTVDLAPSPALRADSSVPSNMLAATSPVSSLNPNTPYAVLPTLSSATQAITSPLGSPAWGQELQQKVSWMVGGQQQSVNIQLNPPHLGPLEIQLQIDKDQATVIFATPHIAVKEAVEAAMPRLQQSFEQQGMGFSGSCLTADPGSQFGQQRQTAQQSPQFSPDWRQAQVESLAPEMVKIKQGEGLVNLFA